MRLIHDIPGTYTIKAIEVKLPPPPLRSKEDVLEVYPNLFKGLARLNDDTKPLCHDLPRGVPLPLIVVVPWPNGDVRMYLGLTKLHQAVKRELYQISTITVESTLGSIGQGAVYLKLDANSGFHQLSLVPTAISSRQCLLHLWKVSATTRYLLSS